MDGARSKAGRGKARGGRGGKSSRGGKASASTRGGKGGRFTRNTPTTDERPESAIDDVPAGHEEDDGDNASSSAPRALCSVRTMLS